MLPWQTDAVNDTSLIVLLEAAQGVAGRQRKPGFTTLLQIHCTRPAPAELLHRHHWVLEESTIWQSLPGTTASVAHLQRLQQGLLGCHAPQDPNQCPPVEEVEKEQNHFQGSAQAVSAAASHFASCDRTIDRVACYADVVVASTH
jgi:hypothetical protein